MLQSARVVALSLMILRAIVRFSKMVSWKETFASQSKHQTLEHSLCTTTPQLRIVVFSTRYNSFATAWRWVKTAVKRAEELGAIAPGKRISTHTLRHSYARHLLMNGIPINYLSRWLGHSSIQTTLIYLELVPDPTGSLAMVP